MQPASECSGSGACTAAARAQPHEQRPNPPLLGTPCPHPQRGPSPFPLPPLPNSHLPSHPVLFDLLLQSPNRVLLVLQRAKLLLPWGASGGVGGQEPERGWRRGARLGRGHSSPQSHNPTPVDHHFYRPPPPPPHPPGARETRGGKEDKSRRVPASANRESEPPRTMFRSAPAPTASRRDVPFSRGPPHMTLPPWPSTPPAPPHPPPAPPPPPPPQLPPNAPQTTAPKNTLTPHGCTESPTPPAAQAWCGGPAAPPRPPARASARPLLPPGCRLNREHRPETDIATGTTPPQTPAAACRGLGGGGRASSSWVKPQRRPAGPCPSAPARVAAGEAGAGPHVSASTSAWNALMTGPTRRNRSSRGVPLKSRITCASARMRGVSRGQPGGGGGQRRRPATAQQRTGRRPPP